MDESTIAEYIINSFADVETTIIPSGTFFFVDPQKMFAFATLITSDEFDDGASNLDSSGAYRLNLGISKATYQTLFGPKPAKGEPEKEYDFTVQNQILPHPVYSRMYWICVLNPSVETFDQVIKPLISEAYQLDVARHRKQDK